MKPQQTTVRTLIDSGYTATPLRQEMRRNLVTAMRNGVSLFPGLHGYEETVIPQLENAILAGHDVLLLGERGQAKSRLARSLTALLDEWIPVIAGSETNDDPLNPISAYGRQQREQLGDETPIEWIHRSRRFAEKLATPDTSIADLIGEIDPIKVAEGRYLSNEETVAFGLIPRANRGVFNLNELPDLSERIQVGLLNILEERDVQIRGFTIRLPLDIMVVASANPEDYTNRGRIITPLKDRFGSQIRTHYPRTVDQELRIVDQESSPVDIEGMEVVVPEFMRELIATISHVARSNPEVSTRSGVSVRMTIANYEALAANAARRALLAGDTTAVASIFDLPALLPTMMGKIEFETWEVDAELRVVDAILAEAIQQVFRPVADQAWVNQLRQMIGEGRVLRVDPLMGAERALDEIDLPATTLEGAGQFAHATSAAEILSAVMFALEAWHLAGRIRKSTDGTYS